MLSNSLTIFEGWDFGAVRPGLVQVFAPLSTAGGILVALPHLRPQCAFEPYAIVFRSGSKTLEKKTT